MTEPNEKKGRPKREDRESILSERLGGIVVSKAERDGIDMRVRQLLREIASKGGRVSVAGYIRSVIVADLQAHGCLPANVTAPAELDAGAPPEVEPPPSPSSAAAPAPPPSAPVAAEPPQAAAAKDAPKDKPLTAAAVRKRLERAYARGLTRNDLAELSGIDVGRLSHFRSENAERGKLSEAKLRDLDGALDRWEQEQEGGR